MIIWRGAAIIAALCMFWWGPVAAQSVTLSLKDGSFSVSGRLRSFDGEFYDLDSALGPMTWSALTTDCFGDACPDPKDYTPYIRIAGSAALGEILVPALIESFASQRGWTLVARAVSNATVEIDVLRADDVRVAIFEISLSSTEAGYAGLANGEADIVLARRAPVAAELAQLQDTYTGGSTNPVRSRVIGWEHLRLYTNETNPISALTVSALASMTAEPDATWPGEDGQKLHLRGDLDSVLAMRQQLGQDGPAGALGTGADTDPGVLYVTPNPSLPLQPVALSPTCGPLPTTLSISNDVHPLSAPMYVVTSAIRQSSFLREFLDFTLDLPAQRVVARAGFLSRTPTEAPLASENGLLVNAILNATSETALDDLQDAVRGLNGYGRLSLTFRFNEGSMDLDDVSKSNLDFAAALLRQGRYRDRDVLFAGFSDGVGAADGNLRLSQDRARIVRDAIRTRMGENAPAVSQFAAQGFGEALPLACNDTNWGQNQNRRVEIWLR